MMRTISTITLACPRCKNVLSTKPDGYNCQQCDHFFRSNMGIPDLRLPEEKTSKAEEALIQQLLEKYSTADFSELALTRVQARPTTEERKQKFANYNLMIGERSQRFHSMFVQRMEEHWMLENQRAALDIGCGIGPGILALSKEYDCVVGLDFHLSALIVAKKLIETEGLQNVHLIQASALDLPFAEKQFDYAISINVLEHIFDPDKMLREVYRVLSDKGIFGGDSRNRYDPFFPEPHVGLRWLGFLPRIWMEPYVRWRMNVNYDHTHLLSYWDLKRAASASFRKEWRIVMPDVAAYGVKFAAVRWLIETIHRFSALEAVMRHLSPTHLLFTRRIGEK